MSERGRTRSCDSDAEPTLFVAPVYAEPADKVESDRCDSSLTSASPRSPRSPIQLRRLEERLEAASFRREEAIGELRRRCGQRVQRARYALKLRHASVDSAPVAYIGRIGVQFAQGYL